MSNSDDSEQMIFFYFFFDASFICFITWSVLFEKKNKKRARASIKNKLAFCA